MNGTFFCTKCGAANAASAQFCSRCGTSMAPTAGVAPVSASASGPAPAAYPAAPAYQSAQVGVRYGGFWIRVVAFIIDAIIVRTAAWPIGMIFGLGGLAGTFGGFPHSGMGLHLLGSGVVLVVVVFGSWLYEAFMLSSTYQATLGKMIFGMKVSDLNGRRISFGRATGRHFAKWLSSMILGIGYIMVGFTERKQGLHDMLAGTLVMRS
jgi:uncharacterized RDD family membrane protein YckC